MIESLLKACYNLIMLTLDKILIFIGVILLLFVIAGILHKINKLKSFKILHGFIASIVICYIFALFAASYPGASDLGRFAALYFMTPAMFVYGLVCSAIIKFISSAVRNSQN